MSLTIKTDDLTSSEIREFLKAHLTDMLNTSPAESVHALDIDQLRSPDVSFWVAHWQNELVGCVALKSMGKGHGEIKSMRTSEQHRGQGIGRQLVDHVVAQARAAGMTQLFLETGSMDFFKPARQLYESAGFDYCEPFGDYAIDDNSVFMTRALD